MKIALLVSGGLGLQALRQLHDSSHELVAVLTDKGSEAIRDFCAAHDIRLFAGNPRSGRCPLPNELETDLLLSVNYLFLVERDLIDWPRLMAVNLHGALLPRYRGRTPHVWSIINNEKEAGVTAHLIDDGCDTGDILLQRRLPITDQDTGGTLLEKLAAEYRELIDELLVKAVEGALNPIPQDESRATYFGKRTPADGAIDWNWQRERIRNWVRAQARPYPGAFSFCRGQKITVHKAEHSDLGFHYTMPNGLVLQAGRDGIVVKTPNGALALSELEMPEGFTLREGDVFTYNSDKQ